MYYAPWQFIVRCSSRISVLAAFDTHQLMTQEQEVSATTGIDIVVLIEESTINHTL